MEGVDQSEFDGSGEHRDGGSLNTQTDKSEDDTIGILESSLRFPEDADESERSEDIGNDGTDEPEARSEVSDIVEVADVGGLKRDRSEQ